MALLQWFKDMGCLHLKAEIFGARCLQGQHDGGREAQKYELFMGKGLASSWSLPSWLESSHMALNKCNVGWKMQNNT